MVVDLIRIFRVLQISKLIRHLTEFQLLVKILKISFFQDSCHFYPSLRRSEPPPGSSTSGSTASPCLSSSLGLSCITLRGEGF